MTTDGEGADVVGFLTGVALFADLDADVRAAIARRCTVLRQPAGSWLFRQHDEGDGLYVVRTGRVELIREDPGPATPVGVLGPGEAFGELSLLFGEPRTLSAQAIRDSEVVRLDRDDVAELLRESTAFSVGLTRVVARFLQDRALARGTADAQGAVMTVIALDPSVSIDDLRTAMAAIPARRRVVVLDDSSVATGVVGEAARGAEYSRLLDGAEREHDRVFLLAGAQGTPPDWDRFCVRQADRIIALVPPGLAVPAAGAWPELDGCDLVFWGPPHRVAGVAAWLDRFRPRSHHFVDPMNLTPTLARALRRLAGLSVGLVLSGGGARALAHIGAIDGLREAGIAVDRIGGSSFGALLGAMFAIGMTPEEAAEHCRRELVHRSPFRDYAVPRTALLRGRRLTAALERIFGDALVEASPVDFFAVSADLLSSELVVHRRGRFVDVLAASLALPGILPPIVDGTRLLVDGSVLSGLPIHVMLDADEGPIVAVDVLASNLKVHRRSRQSLPPIIETISRAALLGGSHDPSQARARARLVIEPDTRSTGQLEFDRLDALIEAGRAATRHGLASVDDLVSVAVASVPTA